MHLAAAHLPASTIHALGERHLRRNIVTVFHGHEGLYFSAGPAMDPERSAALELGAGRYCVLQSAPWIRLLAHLHWLEGRETDHTAGPEEKVVDWTMRTLARLAGVRPPRRHSPEEEIGSHRAAASWRISGRAIARLAEGCAQLPLRRPECRALWLTLGRCLVDPPPSRGRALTPPVASRHGLRLYRGLMQGQVDLEMLRRALWEDRGPIRTGGSHAQIPVERS
jgi:hypothetical protein